LKYYGKDTYDIFDLICPICSIKSKNRDGTFSYNRKNFGGSSGGGGGGVGTSGGF
jgi:hypothetical protein